MNPDQRGLTLIEILIALAIFAVVIVGALGAIGSTTSGLMEGFPTASMSARGAKDYTVASVYLQAFQEYMADHLTDATIGVTVPVGTTSFSAGPPPPASVFGFIPPSGQPYQLDWTELEVTVERWYWYCGNAAATPPVLPQYAPIDGVNPDPSVTEDQMILVRARLTWRYQGQTRTVPVERFVPYRPDIPLAVTPCP